MACRAMCITAMAASAATPPRRGRPREVERLGSARRAAAPAVGRLRGGSDGESVCGFAAPFSRSKLLSSCSSWLESRSFGAKLPDFLNLRVCNLVRPANFRFVFCFISEGQHFLGRPFRKVPFTHAQTLPGPVHYLLPQLLLN